MGDGGWGLGHGCWLMAHGSGGRAMIGHRPTQTDTDLLFLAERTEGAEFKGKDVLVASRKGLWLGREGAKDLFWYES
jgi:hypothetical protein